MTTRHLPVRPSLDQLKREAAQLLLAVRRNDPEEMAEMERVYPRRMVAGSITLAVARDVLARSYGVAGWARLVQACKLIDAIWRDDADAVRDLVERHRRLLHEQARGTETSNWGPPMTYAANLGRDRIILMLRELGAVDVESAFDRAVLQGQIRTARMLIEMAPMAIPQGAVMGPAETQNGPGMAYLLEMGAEISDTNGSRLAPVAMVLETYCRNPEGKHRCLELFAARGIDLPDTAPMAVHRGSIDRLADHLRRDPDLLTRTFRHEQVYPPELGCHDDASLALCGTPLAGGTLLHMCVDYGELDIARWLLGRGMAVDARAATDAEGFGGHSALFGSVVSQLHAPQKHGLDAECEFARLLLDNGADPNARASLRKRMRFVEDETVHEYRDVTPLSWGRRFHYPGLVSTPAMKLIEARGGHD